MNPLRRASEGVKVERESPPHMRAVFNGWGGGQCGRDWADVVTLLVVRTDAGWSAANLSSKNGGLPALQQRGDAYRDGRRAEGAHARHERRHLSAEPLAPLLLLGGQQ
jgi:hypothetical protein